LEFLRSIEPFSPLIYAGSKPWAANKRKCTRVHEPDKKDQKKLENSGIEAPRNLKKIKSKPQRTQRDGATTKNLLTTEDTKEHEGKPTPKLTAEDAKVAKERRGKQLGKNLRKKRRNLRLVIRRRSSQNPIGNAKHEQNH